MKRIYAAARTDRLNASWQAGDTSPDQEVYNSIVQVRSRANALHRDSGLVRAAVRAIVDEVIGCGLTLKPMVKRGRVRGAESAYLTATNQLIAEWWQEWARKEHFDTAGMRSLHRGARQMLTSKLVTGEWIGRFISQPFGGGRVPLAVEFIPPELLDHRQNGVRPNGRQARLGVEVDDWQRPTAYGFTERHPNALWTTWQRIGPINWVPADEILHIYEADRVGQSRGIGDLAALINQTWNVHEYQANEIHRQRATSSLLGFILRDLDWKPTDDENAGSDAPEWDIEPVTMRTLDPGERVEMPHVPPSDPSAPMFLRDQRQSFTSGIGAPYEKSTGDYGQANFSRAKLAKADAQPHIENLRNFVIERYYEPIIRRWLDAANDAGMPLPGFAQARPRYFAGMHWRAAGRPLLEPAKELPAMLDAVDRGAYLLQDVLDQLHGTRTVEEQLEQRAVEEALAERYGLDLKPVSGGSVASVQAPPEPPEDDALSVADEGEDGDSA